MEVQYNSNHLIILFYKYDSKQFISARYY